MVAEPSVVCPVLVGRDAPLASLLLALERAGDARGGTLLVSGEAGIGKSRLARAVVEGAVAQGFVVLQGACFEADRAQPFAPVLDVVKGLAASASPGLAAHYFGPAAGELVALFPELRSTFPGVEPRAARDPEEDRRRLFPALTEALHAIGRVQPLLLVLEDVHWSDDATLDLVLHVARRIPTQRVALLLTFRSDEVGPRLARLLADLDRARCAAEVPLSPLPTADVSAMLQAIFGDAFTSAPFVERLHEITEGNPFFVEEMLKALVVAGDLVRTAGAWRARPLEYVRVPRTATEAVARRLARLSEPARRIAEIAAVAGRRFDFALLQALTAHDERELLSLVRELIDAQLVVEESADRFAFRHALTREAIRTRLLARERVALHRAIAEALARQHDGASGEVAEALAYHTFEAGDWEAARGHALRAAAHARTLRAPREALQQLERAVTATISAGHRVEPSLLVARGRAHETLGAFQPANDDFVAALEAARDAGDQRAEWEALHALGMLWAARDYARAGRFRRDALDVARAIGDRPLVARSLNRVGNWHVNRDEPAAGIPFHDEALAIFEEGDDARGVAETVDLLAMAEHIAGAQEAAVALYERSIQQFAALDDRRGLANAVSVLAVCGPSHHASAGPVSLRAHAGGLLASERAARLTTEIGWRAGESFSRWLLADALTWRGDYRRALALARESLAIAEELDHLQWQCGARRVLGAIALDACAPAVALPHLEAVHDVARRLGSATWIRWTGAPFAIALVHAGLTGRAAAVLADVQALVPSPAPAEGGARERTLGERMLALARAELALATGAPADALATVDVEAAAGVPRALLLRGRALAALGDEEAALSALDAARAAAEAHGGRPLVWRIDAAAGAIHLAARRRREARRAFDAARAGAAELVAALDDALLDDVALGPALQAGVDAQAPPPPPPTPNKAAKSAHGGLTARERDTAALVARGDSNRAIARALGIGERTVEGHVAAALAKLGFTSRAQLAVWASERGLAAGASGNGRARR